MTQLSALFQLDYFVETLLSQDTSSGRPRLSGFGASCRPAWDVVRPRIAALRLSGDDGAQLFLQGLLGPQQQQQHGPASSFPSCASLSYCCSFLDLQALNMALSYAAAHLSRLQQLEITYSGGSTPDRAHLCYPLSLAAGCSALTSLSLISPAVQLSQADFRAVGRLTGLTQLTLRLCCRGEPLQFELGGLQQLQQLTVGGIALVPPPPPSSAAAGVAAETAAAAAAAAAGAAGRGSSPQQQQQLASSLVSLTLQPGFGEGSARDVPLLSCWWGYLPQPSSLQQLRLEGFSIAGMERPFFEQVDFARVPQLRQLVCLVAPYRQEELSFLYFPRTLCKLTALEELWVDASSSSSSAPNGDSSSSSGSSSRMGVPWMQQLFTGLRDPETGDPWQAQLLRACSRLERLGNMYLKEESLPVALPQLTHLAVKLDGLLRAAPAGWLTREGYPKLASLVLAGTCFSAAVLQPLAQLTALTRLRLDMGYLQSRLEAGDGHSNVAAPGAGDWSGLAPLGAALPLLRRLELVSCGVRTAPRGSRPAGFHLLAPQLEGFAQQLRQLQLVNAARSPGHCTEPGQAEWLRGLSVLLRLQALQLEGYSSVTPELAVALTGALPCLVRLAVGLPASAADGMAAAAEDCGEGDAFEAIRELLLCIRPGLDFAWSLGGCCCRE